MAAHEWRAPLARYGAPVAFLAAATAAALLIRAGLKAGSNKPDTPAATVTESIPSGKRAYYHVRAGDTLSTVAERFKTTVDTLFTLNPSIDPNSLRIGQRLRVH
ncbi:MAG: LysM peptidoglycan-binding domain-containing protein [Actinobacteria bacterium]|nr:LysM peptidoglycan-binding domain-containing protein [Actinomycetota bacterium]